MTPIAQSPFARRAYAYFERGYVVIPIAPGTKRPGSWTKEHGWRGMNDWSRYAETPPTKEEIELWESWPDAGIGLLLGKGSKIVALDRDYDTNGTDALDRLIPPTLVKKKGAKGWTGFYRYNGEKSCSFNINGVRVLDVLSDGRQTLMPGTIHPDGHTYIWLTEDILEELDPDDLPTLPDDFLARVAAVIKPYQTAEDQKFAARKKVVIEDNSAPINTDLSPAGQYYRDLNRKALLNLGDWVPKLIPGARPERDGFRCVATWRNCTNANVGVHPRGIVDWGGNYGMTALDLVMYSNGVTFAKAAEALRSCLQMDEPEPISLTVGASVAPLLPIPPSVVQGAPTQAPVLPWQRQTAVQEPVHVMLPPETSFEPAPAIPSFILNPPGIIGVIARWITATAPKSQPELSVCAALGLCATAMGRTYRTQFGNFSSLYLIMVAKSTEGKEHPQSCVERVLTAAGLQNLIGGSGYTSPGAVYSGLLKSPSHIVVIDELGKLLKLSRQKGQSHSEAAIDKLVEAFGRLDGIMRPPGYSTMTSREKITSQPVIHNPAITLLGATTPATFYGALTSDLVHDGFLGRCIVVESKQPRQLTQFVERTEPPEQIVDWARSASPAGAFDGDLAGVMVPDLPAKTIELLFSEGCLPILRRLEERLNDEKNSAEGEGLDVLLGRTQEKAMRAAMCAALAEDVRARVIEVHHLQWAIDYVLYYDLAMVRAVRENRIENQHDSDIKKMITFVRSAKKHADDPRWGALCAQGVMPRSLLLRLMRCSAKTLNELVDTATDAGIMAKAPMHVYGGAGVGDVYLTGDSK